VTSFLKELREAAMVCPKPRVARACKDTADAIQEHLTALAACPSHETMRLLNGAWVRGVNALMQAAPAPDNSPRSGAGEVERERIAA
jgi:hypothetical protein